jgi:hypothetical protein
MASEVFEAQVALLVRVLPHVATETCFALKGGTAINLSFETCPASRWTSIWCICRLRIERHTICTESYRPEDSQSDPGQHRDR